MTQAAHKVPTEVVESVALTIGVAPSVVHDFLSNPRGRGGYSCPFLKVDGTTCGKTCMKPDACGQHRNKPSAHKCLDCEARTYSERCTTCARRKVAAEKRAERAPTAREIDTIIREERIIIGGVDVTDDVMALRAQRSKIT
jgi:hypothetical protein